VSGVASGGLGTAAGHADLLDPADVMDAGSAVLAELSLRCPGMDALVAPDVVLSALGIPFARVNSATAARFTTDTADARIDAVVAWFHERGLPFVWRLGPADRPADLPARLLAHDFTLDPDHMPGMAASLDDLPAIELPEGASIEPVRDRATFRTWLDVLVEGFAMPPEIGDAYVPFGELGFGDDLPTRPLLAFLDGRPVATALGALAGEGVVIANVTTVAEARGRGLGRAITLAAMHAGAASGARMAVLASTEMGQSVYRRLGFEEFGLYGVAARLPD
jgi:ribosomal protein S18 acetylase RimI-like enzyme